MAPSSNQQLMKPLIFAAVFILALSSFAWAQDVREGLPNAKCTLTSGPAPELRGFRLGMAQERVLARFPGSSVERADEFGLTKLNFVLMNHDSYPGGSPAGRDRGLQTDITAPAAEGRSFLLDTSRFPDLKDVRKIRLRFIDGRISYVQLGYDDSFAWNDIDEFVQVISKALGLDGKWQKDSQSDSEKEKNISCEGFLMTASLGGDALDYHVGARLSLEDPVATKMIEKRQSDQKDKAQRQEEERRKKFKP
jgi:hypothetical protein